MLYWQIELVVPSKTIVALIWMQQINLVVVSGEPSKIIVALIGMQQINLVVVSILPSKIIRVVHFYFYSTLSERELS